ncbi:MAG: sugar kinase [Candidatus Doudnabacteria bacterium]|nr:sugar kinase [Candidatus Doudnabacteria bacterium]
MSTPLKASPLLCIGSVAYDSIITPFGQVNRTLGGSATYFSLASSLFSPTQIIAIVGSDFKELDVFKKREIDISGLQKAQGKTFHWAGKYHFDLNTRETLKTELGVFDHFKPTLDVKHRASEYVFLGNIHPRLQLDVLAQITTPKLVGLDTMNFWIEKAPRDLVAVMKKIDVLVINDSEARQLSKEHNLVKAARKILKMMGGQKSDVLIIKQGEHGLLMFHYGSIFNLPGFPLENVVDPTGAGDSFAGGFMGYLAKTQNLLPANLKTACAYGSVVASFCVEEFGTQRFLTLKKYEVAKRLKQFKQLTHFHN